MTIERDYSDKDLRAALGSSPPLEKMKMGQNKDGGTVWKPVKDCPWQTVVLVRNKQMEKPVLATRGFTTEQGVHPDDTFFTSVFTPDRFFPFPAGKLVCPDEWTESQS